MRQLRVEQCDVVSVLAAASSVAGERRRGAEDHDLALPEPAWATVDEIARLLGAPSDVVQSRVEDALQRELLHAGARGLTVTPAGRRHVEHATGLASL